MSWYVSFVMVYCARIEIIGCYKNKVSFQNLLPNGGLNGRKNVSKISNKHGIGTFISASNVLSGLIYTLQCIQRVGRKSKMNHTLII